MAKRKYIECKQRGCHELTRSKEGYCDKHINEYRQKVNQRKREWEKKSGYKHPKNNTKTEKFYSSAQWQFLRESKKADVDYLCEECSKHGVDRTATNVHHKVPILKDWDLRFDYDNLEALCWKCHKYLRHGSGEYTWEQVHSDEFSG